jgi:hypothetical protein
MDTRPSTLSRRSVLAGCAVGCGALAGCLGATGGSDDCSFGFELTMTPATDEDYLAETLTEPSRDRPDAWREIVSTAVERGETEYTTVRSAPVRDGDRIAFEGRYYLFAREAVERERVEAHLFAAEYESGRDPPSGATVVAFEQLPDADRAAFRELLPEADRRLSGSEGFSVGGFPVVYPDDAEADSVLLGEGSTWVRYDGAAIELSVQGTERVERVTYRFTAEELAADREAYLAYARETFVVELTGLTEGERDVLGRAVEAGEEGVRLCEPGETERALVERLESIPDSRTPRDRTWFLDYEGEVYLTDLLEFAV